MDSYTVIKNEADLYILTWREGHIFFLSENSSIKTERTL